MAILEKAELRATSMVSIEPELDLGNGRTLEMYWEAINAMRAKQQKYNALLSNVNSLYNELLAEERTLGEMSEHMLSGVKVKFSRNSHEYEMAGGERRSDRKRAQRKTVAVPST
ncbi:hypothetical protein [Nodosilinea sp. FACHB-13]|uniref:hypothetical protein n=1 Tax=Cyanophyceae TaxID=3028117 RepID=UPI0016840435|nr:hypothetical protein [Nodosilinea sp. FACHB-13]MBD2109834.1 hypothetical protein [Nodosilinea sp. FACHB-13]